MASKNIVVSKKSEEPESTSKDDKEDDSFSLYLILAIVMILIGLIIGWIVGRNKSKKNEDILAKEEDFKGERDQAQPEEEVPRKDFEEDIHKNLEEDIVDGEDLGSNGEVKKEE